PATTRRARRCRYRTGAPAHRARHAGAHAAATPTALPTRTARRVTGRAHARSASHSGRRPRHARRGSRDRIAEARAFRIRRIVRARDVLGIHDLLARGRRSDHYRCNEYERDRGDQTPPILLERTILVRHYDHSFSDERPGIEPLPRATRNARGLERA